MLSSRGLWPPAPRVWQGRNSPRLFRRWVFSARCPADSHMGLSLVVALGAEDHTSAVGARCSPSARQVSKLPSSLKLTAEV